MATRKKAADKPAIDPERLAEIIRDAKSGTNWASEHGNPPPCLCGAFPEGSMVTSWGQTIPKGHCHRHGTTQANRLQADHGE